MSTDALIARLLRAVPARVLPVLALGLVVVAVAAAVLLPGGSGDADRADPRVAGPAAAAEVDLPVSPVSDLPTVSAQELPPEALETLDLIERGGPFPYDRDGLTFGNRERLLPPHERGWYAEYTVITPGEDDRGARRIVAGSDGARFYTDDHYDSFREVVG